MMNSGNQEAIAEYAEKAEYCGHICTPRKRMRKRMRNALLHTLRMTTMSKQIHDLKITEKKRMIKEQYGGQEK